MKTIKWYLQYVGTLVLRCLLNVLNVVPIKSNRVMFYSFNGKQYSCNPRSITEYLVKHTPGKLELIWAFKNPDEKRGQLPAGVTAVKYRSLKYYWLAKTSKVLVYNVQGYGELARRKNQVFIQTWHASNGYKKTGAYTGIRRKIERLYHRDYSYVMSGSESMTTHRVRGTMAFEGPVLNGTPRMDLLINHDSPTLRSKVMEHLGLPASQKLLLYAPTWREDRSESDYGLEYAALKQRLEAKFGGEWVIAVRLHPNVRTKVDTELSYVMDVTKYPDMQELLYVADMLISDYSSCIWDYSFMGNPCFLYCKDLERYEQDRNFDIPITQWHFPIATDMEQLLTLIDRYDEAEFRRGMALHHEEMGNLEDGKATERVCALIENSCGICD